MQILNRPLRLLVCAGMALAVSAREMDGQTPEITAINPPQLWQKAEFALQNAPAASNNFDPDLIRVDATFVAPSGARITVPAFWYQDYARAESGGADLLTPQGDAGWRIRYTPAESGVYNLSVSIQTNGVSAGDPVSARFTVPAAPAPAQRGYVRLAPDKRYFETTDGKPLRLVGQNVCWAETRGTFDYDAWFGAMRNTGENFARLWLAPWFAGLEHKPGTLNHYDLQGAWQLDYIFEQAERDGIYVMLCFDHHGMYQVDNQNWGGSNNFWKTNPYNELNGGPCAAPDDFFTNAKAQALYQKRLRYLIGRYGYSPRLLAWQFFNEIDNVFGTLKAEDVVAWHRQMGQWLHNHDPYRHLVTTSLTGGSERPEIWSLPEMDFSMYHSYYESAPGLRAASLAQEFTAKYGKPMMIGEFGIDARSWNIAADPYLRGFRQAIWGGALGGSVGTAMPWWWQDMHAHDVYPLFSGLKSVLDRAGWQEGEWTPLHFEMRGATPATLAHALPDAAPFTAVLPLNSSWRLQHRLSDKLAVANELAASRASESLSGYLVGKKDAQYQHPILLSAFFSDKARLVFHVKAVYSQASLTVRVDDTEILHTNFALPDSSSRSPRDIDSEFAFDLPAGKHQVAIGNDDGADWILLDSLRLEQVRPAEGSGGVEAAPECVGLRNGNKAVLYMNSPWVIYPADALCFNPPLQSNLRARIDSWPAGTFKVRWFDPSTGQETCAAEASSDGSGLVLSPPPFRDDLAVIITPE